MNYSTVILTKQTVSTEIDHSFTTSKYQSINDTKMTLIASHIFAMCVDKDNDHALNNDNTFIFT